jgi:hypothetical protein
MKKRTLTSVIASACAALWLVLNAGSGISAQRPPGDPNTCAPAECGRVSPLIPMQSTEAVHMGLVWKTGSQKPKILYHARFPEYIPNDVGDPAIVDAALAAGALTDGLGATISTTDCTRSISSIRTPNSGSGVASPAPGRTGGWIPSAWLCSCSTRTHSSMTIAIPETSRALSRRNPPMPGPARRPRPRGARRAGVLPALPVPAGRRPIVTADHRQGADRVVVRRTLRPAYRRPGG